MITFWLPGYGLDYVMSFNRPFNQALSEYIDFFDIPPIMQGDICFDIL